MQPTLDASDLVGGGHERGSPCHSGDYQSRPAIGGVRPPFDQSRILEMSDQLAHRLLGYSRSLGQRRDASTSGIEMTEHRIVRWAQAVTELGAQVVVQL